MPAARYFDPNADRVFSELEQSRARLRQYQAQATQQQAQQISALRRAAPNLPAGVVYPMALSNVDPADPVVAQVSDKQAKRNRKKGILGNIGDVFSGTIETVQKVADEAIYDPIKGFSRGTFAGPQFFKEALDEGVRELINPDQDFDLSATTLGAGLDEIRQKGFRNLDYGDGFFVGGNVKKRQVAAAREGGLNEQGKAWTIGRAAASWHSRVTPMQQSERGYNIVSGLIDAVASLATDPTSYVGGAVVKPAQASLKVSGSKSVVDVATGAKAATPEELRQVAGLIESETRNTYLPDRAYDWLIKSDEGSKLRGYLASETNFERLRQATKGKVPVELLAKLTDATDEDAVVASLAEAINTGQVVDKFRVGALDRAEAAGVASGMIDLGIKLRRRKRDSRLWALMPGHEIDFENLDDAVEQLNRFQQNAKLDIDTRGANNLALIKADSPEARYKAVRTVLAQVAEKVEAEQYEYSLTKLSRGKAAKKRLKSGDLDAQSEYAGDLQKRARSKGRNVAEVVTRAFDQHMEESKFLADDLLSNVDLPGGTPSRQIALNGTLVDTVDPHLWVEGLHRNFPLPDAREIRRVLANPRMRALLDRDTRVGSKVRAAEDAADFFRDKVWVPAKLLRGAYAVRNLMEAQLSSAAGGYATGFYHPLHYLGYVLWNPKGRQALEETLSDAGRVRTAAGKAEEALSRKVKVRGATDALGRDFQQLSADAQHKDAYGQMLDKIGLASYRTDDGKRVLTSRDYVEIDKAADTPAFTRAWAGRLSALANDPVAKRVLRGTYEGETPEGLAGFDAVSEWFWSGAGRKFREGMAYRDEALNTREGADAYLQWLDSAAKQMTGDNIDLLDALRTGRLGGTAMWVGDTLNNKFVGKLADYLDLAPARVSGPRVLTTQDTAGHRLMEHWDNTVRIMFQALAAVPENKLSRSPIFRQAYWRRMADLAENLTKDQQLALLGNAEKANIEPKLMKQLREAVNRRSGELTLDGADEVAKRHGLDEVRRWLYTSHNKTQFFDVTRQLFVFGDAWLDIAKRWTRIAATRPQVPYRIGRAVEEGREADLDGDGRGFFFRDPTTGEERFAWPGSNEVIEALTGVDASFDSSLKSLNMVTQSVMPGIGPTTSLPASWFIPDQPEWDAVRKIALPFGEPDGLGVMPPFLDKALTAFESKGSSRKRAEAYAATQMDVMRHLYSTGEYDLSDPADVQDLLEDSKDKTRNVFLLRAVAQFGLPAAPSPNFKVQIKDQKTADIAVLSSRLRQLQDEDYESAIGRFLEEFGDSAMLILGSKTENLGSAEPTKEAGDFARRNSGAAERFKDVYGFFVGPSGAFDPDTYQAQRDRGERVAKTPEDFLADAEQKAASHYYRKVKDMVGPRPGAAGQEILRQAREALKRDFTKYNPARYEPGKVEDTISRLREAATDPTLSSTEAGQGLVKYLKLRDLILKAAAARGVSGWGRAKETADLREVLRAGARALSSDHPDFADMFDRALSREMVSDE